MKRKITITTQKHSARYLFLLIALAIGNVITVGGDARAAAIAGLFNTGVDDNGSTLSYGSLDFHYSMEGPISGAIVTPPHASRVTPWASPPSDCAWIAPAPSSRSAPAGTYAYSLHFDLTGFDISTAVITGELACDDWSYILINGVDIGVTNKGFGALHPFAITNGFSRSSNTMEFVVINGSPNGGVNPSGLLVHGLKGSARLAPGTARGSDFLVDLSPYVTDNIRSSSGASTDYPPGPFTTSMAGIPFNLAGFPGTTSGLGVVSAGVGSFASPSISNFPVNVTNAVTVYTIINSTWGTFGSACGALEFFGSEGARVGFDLVEGFNIRDHNNGSFNNVVSTNIMSLYWGMERFDCQGWMLPREFQSQALTNVQLKSYGNNPSGVPTLAAITIQSKGPVIDIRVSGGQATCYWPSTPTNFVLQAASSLENPIWSTAANATAITNNQLVATSLVIASNRFYRLVALP